MRIKDEQKRQALFRATVKLVNEIGFSASSVAKIAKAAGVSPSTIYVFFANKEDLLVSTYLEIKHRMAIAVSEGIDNSLPVRDIVRNLWYTLFDFVSANPRDYDYCEQFANSPFSGLVDRAAIEKEFQPVADVFRQGIEQKIIKNVDKNFIAAFIFHPVSRLANPRLCHDLEMDEAGLEVAFTMAWDAIKL